LARGRKAPEARGGRGLEDGDVLVDLGLHVLADALGDPHNVANLLLLQLDQRVEDAVVEVLLERHFVDLDLVDVEGRLELQVVLEERLVGLNASSHRRIVSIMPERERERLATYGVDVANLANHLLGLGLGELGATLGPQQTKVRVQLFAIILAQLGVHAVPRNVDGASIGLELESESERARERVSWRGIGASSGEPPSCVR